MRRKAVFDDNEEEEEDADDDDGDDMEDENDDDSEEEQPQKGQKGKKNIPARHSQVRPTRWTDCQRKRSRYSADL